MPEDDDACKRARALYAPYDIADFVGDQKRAVGAEGDADRRP